MTTTPKVERGMNLVVRFSARLVTFMMTWLCVRRSDVILTAVLKLMFLVIVPGGQADSGAGNFARFNTK